VELLTSVGDDVRAKTMAQSFCTEVSLFGAEKQKQRAKL